jgi:uncharacterized repeat protein (TIGR03803 family)
LFAISTNGTGFGNFYTFSLLDSGGRNSDGSSPQCRLVVSDNNVYGTAATGGNSGQGAVYCLNPGGSGWWYGCYYLAIGEYPQAGLVLSGNTLYGTCSGPPFGSGGSVFAINTDESNPRLLHNFTGGNDGGKPLAGLILSGNFLFGTTFSGGSSGNGTVFKINTDGSGFTNLYSFSAVSGTSATNNDGANPQADLVLSGNTLYGTTSAGGTSGNGAVFSISLPVSQLTIIPAGETVLLIWPTNAVSFTLQSTTNLASPVWEIVFPAPVVVNMNNVVTNGVSAVQKFYRLTW